MTVGVWVLGDQLSHSQAALRSCQSSQNPVILIESRDYIYQRRYHQQKLVLVWSAMRHFAQELTTAGWNVTYHIGADFLTPLQAWIEKYQITQLRIVTPSDLPFADFLDTLSLSCEIKYFPNHNFLWTRQEFQSWAKTRKRLILEDFYRLGRKKFNILLEGKQPVGGKWNFDQQNRQPPQKNLHPPQPLSFKPDQITRTVIDWVKHFQFSDYGEIEPFNWGVTRQQALQVLDNFIAEGLPNFGTYQDAMVTGEYTMWHSLISPYLNLGLLQPLEVIKKIENAYYQNNLALNSVEGFIRQVLGWREYMYGIYHYAGTDYAKSNWFNHTYPLPEFYWDAKQTKMNCLYQTLVQVEKTGYAHHIQRLMILSNFALIVGFSPQQIEKWFHSAFISHYARLNVIRKSTENLAIAMSGKALTQIK
ncbi:MAG: cryptochrome/photolyase family protein [Cyanobacteria bacterium J083]|nr:MAG: cryptochrome/photolyase family protein [Cyanobacteria bacterium J083]